MTARYRHGVRMPPHRCLDCPQLVHAKRDRCPTCAICHAARLRRRRFRKQGAARQAKGMP